jgi:hypothetical protein
VAREASSRHESKIEQRQHVVHDDTNTGGQVEAANTGIFHRYRKTRLGIRFERPFREAGGFFPKEEGIAGYGPDLRIGTVSLGGEQIAVPDVELFQKFPGVRDVSDSDKLPVIQAGPSQISVVQRETGPPDDNQLQLCSGAETGDIAGILWDLRFDQDDVEHGSILPQSGGL